MSQANKNLRLITMVALIATLYAYNIQSKGLVEKAEVLNKQRPVIGCSTQACQFSCRLEGDKTGHCVNGCDHKGFCWGYCVCPKTGVWPDRVGFLDVISCDDSDCAAYCNGLNRSGGKCSRDQIDTQHTLMECNCE